MGTSHISINIYYNNQFSIGIINILYFQITENEPEILTLRSNDTYHEYIKSLKSNK